MGVRQAEATAPCGVDLAGGGLDVWAGAAVGAGFATLGVAIDRRAWSRVEIGGEGVEVFSKDTVLKAAASSVDELMAGGQMPLVSRVLRAMGVESGVKVETQARVPEGSGLGEATALAVAVAGAAHAALGRSFGRESLLELLSQARGGESAGRLQGLGVALHGGAVAAHLEGGRLHAHPAPVDPARVEESLLLVDSGSTRPAATRHEERAVREATEQALARTARAMGEALAAARFEEVAELMAEEWDVRKRASPAVTTPEIDRIVDLAREAGGAARACGPGPGGLVAVWAPPGARGAGRREAVAAALGAAGVRMFPARVDLLGLDTA